MAPLTRSMTRAILARPYTLHPNALRKLGVVMPAPEPVVVPQLVFPEPPYWPHDDYSPTSPGPWPHDDYSPTSPCSDYSPTTPRCK